MIDLATIPQSELEADLVDAYQDIRDCERALEARITTYSGGSVQERLESNRKQVEVIRGEIERRQRSKPCAVCGGSEKIDAGKGSFTACPICAK